MGSEKLFAPAAEKGKSTRGRAPASGRTGSPGSAGGLLGPVGCEAVSPRESREERRGSRERGLRQPGGPGLGSPRWWAGRHRHHRLPLGSPALSLWLCVDGQVHSVPVRPGWAQRPGNRAQHRKGPLCQEAHLICPDRTGPWPGRLNPEPGNMESQGGCKVGSQHPQLGLLRGRSGPVPAPPLAPGVGGGGWAPAVTSQAVGGIKCGAHGLIPGALSPQAPR